MPTRVMMFVDGFNVYHSIDEQPHLHQFKWLNYATLGRLFLQPDEILVKTFYFTAYTTWDQLKHNRHQVYVTALSAHGVEAVLGRFRIRTRRCGKCSAEYSMREEKETDVNIAVKMLELAHTGQFDVALLMTGDTDQVPTIKLCTE